MPARCTWQSPIRAANSAIFEYLGGKLVIHHGRQYQVMTNSPTFDQQLALDAYWQQIGGLVMLPGTNRAADRFVRASFYVHAIPQTADMDTALASAFGVIRNVSVPLGISTPGQPNIASTLWRTVSDQKGKRYFFEFDAQPERLLGGARRPRLLSGRRGAAPAVDQGRDLRGRCRRRVPTGRALRLPAR